jgi:caa(3)-type oxidase subunit IV
MAHDHAHPVNYKQYGMTWFWLLVMTSLALAIGYVESIPEALKAVLLVGITLAKIVLIGSIFMHLKFERMNLVMLTFSPLVLSIILFFFTFGEVGGSSTHIIMNQNPGAAEQAKEKALHPATEEHEK